MSISLSCRTLVLVASLLMAGSASAAEGVERNAATAPATRPAAWYARLEPFVDPTLKNDLSDEENCDAMYEYIGTLKGFPRRYSREEAFTILLTTTTYASRFVGGGGTRSAQTEAFRVLVAQPDAAEAFEDLYRRAHTAGRLYALCALREIRPGRARELAAPLVASGERVWTFYGCMMQKRAGRAAVAEGMLEGGMYPDLVRP